MNKLERIEALEAEIKKLKQELSEPEFEAGWYWANEKAKAEQTYLAYYENTNSNEAYGFGWAGFWSDRLHTTFNEYKIKATESEVFEALKKEAIKRGFKEGVMFNSPGAKYDFSFGQKLISNELKLIDNMLCGKSDKNKKCCIIFRDGKWAEIIDEPFKVCGYEVRQINKGSKSECFLIGCKTIGRERLEKLSDLMTFNHFKTVQFDEYKVTLEEINKILEL